ncbi:MAG: DUF2339 domain-containing protein [Parasphingorhabdus sp.]|uniref:DUF2339 domain-containing protein n=6 Tax=Parasphingorhabdus sp. TaxID=2709688 RepID=UPI0032652E5C
MEFILLTGLIVLTVLVFDGRKTIQYLRTRVEDLESRVIQLGSSENDPEVDRVAKPAQKTTFAKRAKPPAQVSVPASKPIEPELETPDIAHPVKEPPQEPAIPTLSMAKRFEDLIGGKLPIWIGGIALIFAGFFLVRFSIESGLFGPTARCITATLFGLLLISFAEFGHRIPRFGNIFNDDLRIGHSITGAGIAVLYATLYMASELYGLLGLTSSLIGVISVTILAFILSQKHGPPTAIMGLLGGFAAPYVAGLGPESVAPLLIYLAVFTAGVFGLAMYRGWAWLALLATGGSALWSTALLFMDLAGDMSFVGLFITLLAIGGALTVSRTGTSFGIPKQIIQSIPLGVGLLQLLMLAPLIEFSLMGWLFFGVLSIFAIALAWRDSTMTPSVLGALALSMAMVAMAFVTDKNGTFETVAAIGFAVLFGMAGHFWAMREKDGWLWALCGILAPTGMLAISTIGDFGWNDRLWGALCLLVALPNALMAWRTKNLQQSKIMPLATAVTAILLAIALWLWTADSVAAIVAILIAAALAFWARFTKRTAIASQSLLAVLSGGLIMLVSSYQLVATLAASLAGETDLYTHLPSVLPLVTELALPAAALVGLAYLFRDIFEKSSSRLVGLIGILGLVGFSYLLFKQPLAIGPIESFVAYGFAERIVLTNLCALSGWWLLWRRWPEKLGGPLQILGLVFAGLALFRFIYFDLMLLSPTNIKQALGPAPFANLGTLHYTAAALWLWLFTKTAVKADSGLAPVRSLEIGSLLAAVAAVMVTVRQAVHGSDIASPPLSSTETYLYSAGLLLLAIAWLARGIQTTNALLRISGLLLLTVVTFKVFLVDAAQLEGILRILSFLGLGIALIGIGWMYGKIMKRDGVPLETAVTD